jgi:hypothetical protein
VVDLGLSSGKLLSFGYTVGETDCRLPDWLPPRPAGYPTSGERPWLQTHIIAERAQDLKDERAWLDGTEAVGAFLLVNPDYEGYFGLGWLADESLGEISPHLAFVREQMLASGAIIVSLGDAPDEIVEVAISTSKTRRRMYEEGRWTPTIQCSIYTREEFIAWAESLGLLR